MMRLQTVTFLMAFGWLALTACGGDASGGPGVTDSPVPPAPSATVPPASPTPEAPEPTETPAPTATPNPTATPTPAGIQFSFYGADPAQPAVARGPADSWRGTYLNPGAVFYYDGRFHMFFNGFEDWPGLIHLGYWTSDDGLNWSGSEEPVFTSDQVPYLRPGQGANVSSVSVLPDGTWALFFHTVTAVSPTQIGRATAPGPEGPWLVDPEPILLPGPEGAWDERGLAWPNVVSTDSGYALYFSGKSGERRTRIGLATSPDGVVWTKYDDPATTTDLDAASDPVLLPSANWEGRNTDRPEVARLNDNWIMVYTGAILEKRGIAFSDDGIHWTPHPENPILERDDFPIDATTWDNALMVHEDTLFYYMELGSLAGTAIYVATYQGPVVLP